MGLEVGVVPRPEWSPLPHPGCVGVEARVLLKRETLALAQLRFEPGGTLHEHAAEHEVEVICLEGRARTSVGEAQAELAPGQRVIWPPGVPHRLWTDPEHAATTLMIERLRPDAHTTPATELQGRCFCGAVQVRLTPPTEFCGHCHCANCRLAHAAAFVTWTSVPDARFAFAAGEEGVRWYASRPGTRWGFCVTCGSSLLYRSDDAPGRTYVTAASFPAGLDRLTESHVSYEERVAWLGGHLPCYRGKTDERLA